MTETKPTIVCSTVPSDESGVGICSNCGATVYPTLGTLGRAMREQLPMICMDCFRKLDGPIYGGMMDHGKILTHEQTMALIEEFLLSSTKKSKV